MAQTWSPVTLANDTGQRLNATYFNRVETGIDQIDVRTADLELGVTSPVTVSYAASVTINAAAGSLFRIIATGNVALQEPTNGVDGQTIVVQIQASGGNRVLTFPGTTLDPVTIATGQWWTGVLRRNTSAGEWLLSD